MNQYSYMAFPGLRSNTFKYMLPTEKPQYIIKVVSMVTKIPVDVIYSKYRKSEVVDARLLSMHVMYKYCRMSKSGIARVLGKDHTTILWGLQRISGLLETEPSMRELLKTIESYL